LLQHYGDKPVSVTLQELADVLFCTRRHMRNLLLQMQEAKWLIKSFCHTAAYPKPVDVTTHHTLPDFIMNRGGVSLRPGDGVIHS
ncbi:SgrR family transcriptional regulator, partial [Salmonella enterica subsp. enterica serovar Montevideo]|nr:SgrR family transcriptional regulator [Salmonella enterica subsp. enterica serovar Montevideo]